MRRFYGHFAAAYGTCWLVLMTVAMLTFSHIDLGAFGFFGFLLVALIYALARSGDFSEVEFLRRRVQQLEAEAAVHSSAPAAAPLAPPR